MALLWLNTVTFAYLLQELCSRKVHLFQDLYLDICVFSRVAVGPKTNAQEINGDLRPPVLPTHAHRKKKLN